MKRTRFTEEQIIGFLKQAEAGMPIKELCRQGGSTVLHLGPVRLFCDCIIFQPHPDYSWQQCLSVVTRL